MVCWLGFLALPAQSVVEVVPASEYATVEKQIRDVGKRGGVAEDSSNLA